MELLLAVWLGVFWGTIVMWRAILRVARAQQMRASAPPVLNDRRSPPAECPSAECPPVKTTAEAMTDAAASSARVEPVTLRALLEARRLQRSRTDGKVH